MRLGKNGKWSTWGNCKHKLQEAIATPLSFLGLTQQYIDPEKQAAEFKRVREANSNKQDYLKLVALNSGKRFKIKSGFDKQGNHIVKKIVKLSPLQKRKQKILDRLDSYVETKIKDTFGHRKDFCKFMKWRTFEDVETAFKEDSKDFYKTKGLTSALCQKSTNDFVFKTTDYFSQVFPNISQRMGQFRDLLYGFEATNKRNLRGKAKNTKRKKGNKKGKWKAFTKAEAKILKAA